MRQRIFLSRAGYSLIELLVVVAVLGILAAMGWSAFIGQQRTAARSEAKANLQNLRLLEEQYNAENGCYFMVGNVCTNQAIPTTLIAGAVGFAHLPGFKPGQDASLNYTYSITTSTAPGSSPATAFVATATPKAGKIVGVDVYTIDNNNNRNF